VSVDLLAIVQAEAEADRTLKDAALHKEMLIKEANARREQTLKAINAPTLPPITLPLRQQRIDLSSAKQRKAKAIKRILEELHAA
jgi:cell division septum initiation protein DivIVA